METVGEGDGSSSPGADEDPATSGSQGRRQRPNYLALALIVGVPLLVLGVGLVVGLAGHHTRGPHDFGSTDVKACDLLPQAAVERALGTQVQLPPHPQTARTVQQVSYLYRSAAKVVTNVDVHDLDTCEYDIFPDTGGPSIVTATVARADKAKLQTLFHDAADHNTVEGLTLVRLPAVGDDAVIASEPAVKNSGATVIAQRGDWVVAVAGFTPTAQLVNLANSFADVPRLTSPPGAPQT
jgi:hypothetical protein